jgi:hypothetical protein
MSPHVVSYVDALCVAPTNVTVNASPGHVEYNEPRTQADGAEVYVEFLDDPG